MKTKNTTLKFCDRSLIGKLPFKKSREKLFLFFSPDRKSVLVRPVNPRKLGDDHLVLHHLPLSLLAPLLVAQSSSASPFSPCGFPGTLFFLFLLRLRLRLRCGLSFLPLLQMGMESSCFPICFFLEPPRYFQTFAPSSCSIPPP